MKRTSIVFLVFLATVTSVFGQQLVVGPYLQDAEPTSMVVMWETSAATAANVSYGPTAALGSTSTGSSATGFLFSRIHRVKIENLQPNTTYYYSVNTGNQYSDTLMFRTPPAIGSTEHFGMIAFSDIQKDQGQPNKFREIVEQGVLPFSEGLAGEHLPDKLAFVLVPGDLVDLGFLYPSWKDEFFEPAKAIFEMVPVYPVLGNHEANTAYFFSYFDLPKNGTTGFLEHWWYKDYANTRIIGLESNIEWITGNNGIQKQLDWLQDVLDEACALEHIDFVFAQLHHPHHSELWPDGNSDFTGDVIALMEQFTTACGKPSIHFYGHTHGYSRGQSRDHRHLMVNVASAGGNLDRWGEYGNQKDYPEHTVSEDKYGFVYLEVKGGADPRFSLKRVSRGAPGAIEDNLISDSIVVYRNEQGPAKPEPLHPVGETVPAECVRLEASTFSSASPAAAHGASQYQVFASCDELTAPILDIWQQHENRYFDVDLQAGHDLTGQDISSGLLPYTTYCWRVRYRDQNLRWSEWSEPVSFSTGKATNLLVNAGAEVGTSPWTVGAGAMESLEAGECDGISPYKGSRYFAVGAACQGNAYAEAYQLVDVAAYAEKIDGGTQEVWFGGYLSDFNGSDKPEFRLTYLDAAGAQTGQTQKFGGRHAVWRAYDQTGVVPAGTRRVKFELFGTRGVFGTANDSYFDELYLVLDSLAGQIDTAICAGTSVEFFGAAFDSAGTYTVEDPDAGNCLNRYEVHISVLDTAYQVVDAIICPGDSVEAGGTYFTTEGEHLIVLRSSSGCDSTVILRLEVLEGDDPLCSIPTGLDDMQISGASVYPNPFSEEAVMRFRQQPASALQLKLFNEAGECVRVMENIRSESIIIHRGELVSGIYRYVLSDRDGIVHRGTLVVGR